MVLPYLVGLVVLLLLAALVLAIVIYSITLPLFSQVWLVDLFGDPEVLLPVWVMLLGCGLTISVWKMHTPGEDFIDLPRMVVGTFVSVAGGSVFASAWTGLVRQYEFYNSQEPGIFSNAGSLCQDYVTACLLWGNSHPYPDSTIPALFGAILFYIGCIIWLSGTDETTLRSLVSQGKRVIATPQK